MNKPISYPYYLLGLFLSPFVHQIHANCLTNSMNIESLIEQDTTPPIAYCLNGIEVSLPVTQSITIFARDLDVASYDNVTSASELKFYFDGDPTKQSITKSCEDFIAIGRSNDLILSLQMWVEDEAGNKAYCRTFITIRDDNAVCPSEPCGKNFTLTGNIRTYVGSIADPNNGFIGKIILTGQNGFHAETTGSPYKFTNLTNGTYTLCIEKNDNPLNGLSTAGFVKIKRHILGIEYLNSPYKLIAAYLNRSKNLTAADLSELKKLILGISTKFSKVPSWIFVPADFIFAPNVFPDVNQFIPSCKTIEIKDKSLENVDFIGIKMGNVN